MFEGVTRAGLTAEKSVRLVCGTLAEFVDPRQPFADCAVGAAQRAVEMIARLRLQNEAQRKQKAGHRIAPESSLEELQKRTGRQAEQLTELLRNLKESRRREKALLSGTLLAAAVDALSAARPVVRRGAIGQEVTPERAAHAFEKIDLVLSAAAELRLPTRGDAPIETIRTVCQAATQLPQEKEIA